MHNSSVYVRLGMHVSPSPPLPASRIDVLDTNAPLPLLLFLLASRELHLEVLTCTKIETLTFNDAS